MKKLITFVFAIALFTGATVNAQETAKKGELKGAQIEFDKEVIDYGEVEYASNGEREFIIKNIGDAPLVITRTKGSCGCTVPTKPSQPILPGETGIMKVKYDTKRANQAFSKSITVTSNAVNFPTKVVKIKGKVLANPNAKKVTLKKPVKPAVAAK
ncbi:MAG: DUF1573 domain-containing protein [Flavobacteriaceae bacterium]|nr:DUF1573 domain-containing protein [Flavobacteriaceae bacterium]